MKVDELQNRIQEIEKKLQEYGTNQALLSERITAALKRLDEQKALTESVQKLAMSTEVMAISLKQLEGRVDTLSTDITSIKEKPAKRWDSAASTIITVILTGIITFFLTKLGLK